jgi:hypothetical protein
VFCMFFVEKDLDSAIQMKRLSSVVCDGYSIKSIFDDRFFAYKHV